MMLSIVILLSAAALARGFVATAPSLHQQHVPLFASTSLSENDQRFAHGDDLDALRHDLDKLRQTLEITKVMMSDTNNANNVSSLQVLVDDLTKAITNGQNRDPEHVYATSLQQINEYKVKLSSLTFDKLASHKSEINNITGSIKSLQASAQEARKYLHRFQLQGLWVGDYGARGDQMINITYVGDTVIATKVTGGSNIPRGETTFTANLSPNLTTTTTLVKSTSLDRYTGKGQVAKDKLVDKRFTDGQLIFTDQSSFSFVWLPPVRQSVVFKRPTSTQVIEMLRDVYSIEDELENMRSHAIKCFDMDMTESIARYHAKSNSNDDDDSFRRISQAKDLKAMQQQQQQQNSFKFWNIPAFRKYIDNALDNKSKQWPSEWA